MVEPVTDYDDNDDRLDEMTDEEFEEHRAEYERAFAAKADEIAGLLGADRDSLLLFDGDERNAHNIVRVLACWALTAFGGENCFCCVASLYGAEPHVQATDCIERSWNAVEAALTASDDTYTPEAARLIRHFAGQTVAEHKQELNAARVSNGVDPV